MLKIAVAFSLLALPAFVAAQDVRLASAHGGRIVALFNGQKGLFVEGWRGARNGTLHIGHGSEPRFDGAGNLYFTRAFDDGVRITRRTTLVVDVGATTPRALRPDETAPLYRLPPAQESAAVKVVVDAGHGGSDSGATGNGLLEKNITLDVALRLKKWLDLDTADRGGGGEWSVLMTRSSDVFISLRARSNAANAFAAKSFLSIHMNAFGSASANGSETYCYIGQQNNAGGKYRNRLHTELLAAWNLTNRGVKTANFHVLRETKMPASLIEGGFITNAKDAAKMGVAANRERLALGLLWATQMHHGFPKYTPKTGGATGDLLAVIYDASVGTSKRVVGATVALSDGRFVRSAPVTGFAAFKLAPGTYRYAATAPGYAPAELVRTVTASGTTWGSLGLRPANVPALLAPSQPTAGQPFTMTLHGDARSAAFLLIGSRPRLPLLSFQVAGELWLNLSTSVLLRMSNVPSGGSSSIRVNTPNQRGLRAHVQAYVRSRGAYRLTNGVGIELK